MVQPSFFRDMFLLCLGENPYSRRLRIAGQRDDHVGEKLALITQMLIVSGVEVKANPGGFGLRNLGTKVMADFVTEGRSNRQSVMRAVDKDQRFGQRRVRPIDVEAV